MSRSASSRLRQLISVQLAASLDRNGALRICLRLRLVLEGSAFRSIVVVHLLIMAFHPQIVIFDIVVPERRHRRAGSG